MPSPLAIIAVIAPSALLGALLFFFVYDEHSTKTIYSATDTNLKP